MIDNPFSIIDRRLNKIESILIEIKNEVRVVAPKVQSVKGKKKELKTTSNLEKEVCNG